MHSTCIELCYVDFTVVLVHQSYLSLYVRVQTGVYLMFDEVQTAGGVTGKYWAHEHFNLSHAPHVVAFSKRMLSGGFYFADELRPTEVGYFFYCRSLYLSLFLSACLYLSDFFCLCLCFSLSV